VTPEGLDGYAANFPWSELETSNFIRWSIFPAGSSLVECHVADEELDSRPVRMENSPESRAPAPAASTVPASSQLDRQKLS
jgi:hypothetical protein